jgi:hypothetical protein
VELTGDSDYLVPTFKSVVEHIYGIVLAKGPRYYYATTALEILLTLVKKTSFLVVGAAWINDLLKKAAWGKMDDETFTVLLRFSALREEDEAAIDPEITPGQDFDRIQQDGADPQSPGGTVRPENPTPEYTLLRLVLQNVETCGAQEGGWRDDAVYGGLMTIRDIPGLRFCRPEPEFLGVLSKAMEKGDKPIRVRKAAHDVVLVARYGWLKSADLRETLENLDLPRKLHGIVIETGRSDHQRSFLEMMEILSEDRGWHPYLRNAMEIWLPLHHEGPAHALHILTNVGELLPRCGDYNTDKSLEKVLEDEWAAVPGRLPTGLTVDLLQALAEVTEQFKELFFFTESSRRSVLAAVERVIPSLENRRDDDYSGPGNDIRHTIDNLVRILREPIHPSSRRSTYW